MLNKTELSLRGTMSHMHLGVPRPGGVVPQELVTGAAGGGGVGVEGEADIHVIFSTDCTPYQDWQTIVLFHSATVVGQKGPLTRIASGCTEEKKIELTNLYRTLYPQYHVHFTPDFKKDEKTNKKYDFYNKPWGLKHWLDYAYPPIGGDVVVALIDPDMIFLRPLTTQVKGGRGKGVGVVLLCCLCVCVFVCVCVSYSYS